MLAARPVISGVDSRFFRVSYPWLLTGETIVSASITITPPEDDLVGLFTLSAAISNDGKYLILKSNPYVMPEGPPIEGTEYLIDITVLTSNDQMNKDSIVFIIDEGVYN